MTKSKKTDPRMVAFDELSKDELSDVMYATITQYKIAYALGYCIKSE